MAEMNRKAQSGEALIFTLLAVVVIFLGFLYAMRNVMSNTTMTGNNLTRQKDIQVADIALRNLQQMIGDAYGDIPLEQSGANQAWWRVVAANTAVPTTYWASCLGNSSTASRCGAIPVSVGTTNLNYTAFAVVQTTGRAPELHSCPLDDFAAYYYDIYIHVVESSGVTSATTETVHKLCIKDPSSNR